MGGILEFVGVEDLEGANEVFAPLSDSLTHVLKRGESLVEPMKQLLTAIGWAQVAAAVTGAFAGLPVVLATVLTALGMLLLKKVVNELAAIAQPLQELILPFCKSIVHCMQVQELSEKVHLWEQAKKTAQDRARDAAAAANDAFWTLSHYVQPQPSSAAQSDSPKEQGSMRVGLLALAQLFHPKDNPAAADAAASTSR